MFYSGANFEPSKLLTLPVGVLRGNLSHAQRQLLAEARDTLKFDVM